MTMTSLHKNEIPAFEEHAVRVLQRLRSAVAEILGALPGQSARAREFRKTLKIDKNLAWKIEKIADDGDPFTVAAYVPGRAALGSFLKAAANLNVPRGLIEAGITAAEEFEELVRVHAGDRHSFDAMVSLYLGGDETDRIGLMHRRAAFRANSYVWGAQAQTQFKCVLVHLAENPALIDIATLQGFVNLRRLRPDSPLVLSWVANLDDDGVVRRPTPCEPLDPRVETEQGLALLGDFCSKPLPQLQAVAAEGGVIHGELVGGAVGNTGAVTCVEGNVSRGAVTRYRDEHNRIGGIEGRIHTPCETAILDLLVHEGAFDTIAPKVKVYGQHLGGALHLGLNRERDKLSLGASVVYLGKGPSVLRTPSVPKYADMGRYVLDRLGWDAERFDVYRCRVEYPVMPSKVVMDFVELPERPEP